MKLLLSFIGVLGMVPCGAHAAACEGGLYLNPQVIRGEGRMQAASAADTLAGFLKRTGLPVMPVRNIRDATEAVAAIAWSSPPCWIYGNPVVGLAAGYRPAAVNMDSIQAAVLVFGPVGDTANGKAVNVSTMAPKQAEAVLGRLKATGCYGMKSGVTTALVQAERLCGSVTEVLPQQGLGQSYLPTKAGFAWSPDRWVGVITRLQSAEATTLKNHVATDSRVHMARLYVVATQNSSWGYGLYVHPQAAPETVKKAQAAFARLDRGDPALLRALDVGSQFDFRVPPEAEVERMRKLVAPAA
jgi:hypothetical protein